MVSTGNLLGLFFGQLGHELSRQKHRNTYSTRVLHTAYPCLAGPRSRIFAALFHQPLVVGAEEALAGYAVEYAPMLAEGKKRERGTARRLAQLPDLMSS